MDMVCYKDDDEDKKKEKFNKEKKELEFKYTKTNFRFVKNIINPSNKIYLRALQNSILAMNYIENPSIELCNIALKNKKGLKYINNQNHDLCIKAIELNPFALKYVKEDNHIYCDYAINIEKKCIQFCKHKKTDYYLKFIKNNGTKYIKYINKSLQNQEFCDWIVTVYGYRHVKYFKPEFINYELYKNCIYANIDYYSSKFKDYCGKFLENTLINIDSRYQDKEIALKIIKFDPKLIKYIRKDLLDEDIYDCFITCANFGLGKNLSLIRYLDKKYLTFDLLNTILYFDISVLTFIDNDIIYNNFDCIKYLIYSNEDININRFLEYFPKYETYIILRRLQYLESIKIKKLQKENILNINNDNIYYHILPNSKKFINYKFILPLD